MEKSMKLCVLLLLLFTQLSYSAGEKYTSIVVSKQVDESNGTIFLNITVLYFNTSKIEIPQGPGQPPKIVEQTNISSVENATVYISFYNTSYSEEGKPVQTLVPLPCSPILTNKSYEEDGKVVYFGECTIEGELYSKYFNNTCRGIHFYFPGISLPTESIPPTETTVDVCTGKPTIFEALRGILATAINPEDPFCISMFIIFGLLLATLFFTGRSPLALLDMVTPMLPKPRRFAYTAGMHTIGHKKMKEDAAKVISALDKQIKEKEKEVKEALADLRSLYDKAEPWKKLLALKALEEGNIPLAERLLKSNSPFSIATLHFEKDDPYLVKAREYLLMRKMLDAYDEMQRVSKNKYVNKVLKWMGKQYLLMEIPAALQATAMASRFVKRVVKAPFVRYGELKRAKAVERAATPEERKTAEAALMRYREEKGIKPVNRLFDPLVFGEELYRTTKEQVAKELMSYMLLRVLDKAGVRRKEIDKIFSALKDGIAKKDDAAIEKAIKDLENIVDRIDKLGPRYKRIIETIRDIYTRSDLDPYLKAYYALVLLEKKDVVGGQELGELRKYIKELRYIDRMDAMDIQKFLMTAMYIQDYRRDLLNRGWNGFIPALFTPEAERKSISGNIFSMLFAHEVLSQVKADISNIAIFFFGMRAINPLSPLMEYQLLPGDFKGWVQKEKLGGAYKIISSFSSRMFDELAKRANVNVAAMMKEQHVVNKFALLGKDVFKDIGLNTKGDWHVLAPHFTVSKVPRITSSAFGRALELSYVGRVKESFKNAFENEASILPFSYYSVITKNLVNDFAFELGAIGYYSVRQYVANKLGVPVDALTDKDFKTFVSNKKNLDLYLADFDKGSFILMKGYGAIPFIQGILNPDPSSLDKHFVDKKIMDYIRNRLGYDTRLRNDEIYSKFAVKGGIGLPDSFINTTILVNVDGKFRLWKGKELSVDELYKLDSFFVKKKEKIGPQGEEAKPGDFVKLYQLAASGNADAFNKVKEILIANKRMDAFMSLANAYQMAAKDAVARSEIFKGVTQQHVQYLPMEAARNTVQDWKDRTKLWVERGISGAVKPVLYAGVPYFEAMGTVVATSEVARRIGVEYVSGLSKAEYEREKELATAIKDFEHAWEWTITRDALLYGGFERYGRAGYLTTGFHVGPAMPVTNWMDRRSFSPLFQGIPILDRIVQNIALTTFKLSVGFSRPFVLGARAFGFHRYKYPSVYDIRSDISESNPFVATQAYYPVYSTIPRVRVGATLLYGLASLATPLLTPFGFVKELRERRELPIFSLEELTPAEKVTPAPGFKLPGGRILRGRVVEAIKNSIARAGELKFLTHSVDIRRLGIANLDVYIGAPRTTDTQWFYSPSIANIGDEDTNPGLSYIQSYTGQYVWQPVVGRAIERRNIPVLPRVREHMFDVHEKRTLSALGMAAFYYSEIHWADPFNFKNNPLYTILSPGTALLSACGWGWRKSYRELYKGRMEWAEYKRHHPDSVTSWDYIKFGGTRVSNALRDFVKGRWQRWAQSRYITCPTCGTRYQGPGPCPRCGGLSP